MGVAATTGKLGRKGQIAPVGARGQPLPRHDMVGVPMHGGSGGPIVGKSYPTYATTTAMVTCPSVIAAMALTVPVILSIGTVFVYEDEEFDTTLESFKISDHVTVKRKQVIQAAAADWRFIRKQYALFQTVAEDSRMAEEDSRLRSVAWRRININYEVLAPEGSGCGGSAANESDGRDLLTDPEFIYFMRDFEEKLSSIREWNSVCWQTSFKAGKRHVQLHTYNCPPLMSMTQYYFPGGLLKSVHGSNEIAAGVFENMYKLFWDFRPQEHPAVMTADGMQQPASAVLDTFYQNPNWPWFGDARNTITTRRSKMLRTQITLGRIPKGAQTEDLSDAERLVLDRFMASLLRILDDYAGQMWSGNPRNSSLPRGVRITYGGDGVLESKVDRALDRDWWWVALAVVVVTISFWLYTHSCFIAILAIGQTGLTFYSASFVYISSRDEPMSLLALLAYYVILIMSCDGVMIYFNTFRQTAFMETSGRRNHLNVAQRLAYTYRKAGVSVTVSHLSAGVAFICNAVSPVPAIKSFGVLMVILVTFNWYLFLFFFPCVLVWHHFHISKRRRNAQRQKEVVLRRKQARHPEMFRDAVRDCDTAARMENNIPTAFIKGHMQGEFSADGQLREEDPARRGSASSAAVPVIQDGAAGDIWGRMWVDFGLRGRRAGGTSIPKATGDAGEVADAWDRLAAGVDRQSRRKQERTRVLQFPAQLTCVNTAELRPTRPDVPLPQDAGEGVPIGGLVDRRQAMDDFKTKFREPWLLYGLGLQLVGPYGSSADSFVDKKSMQPGRKFDAWKRIAQSAQVLHESAGWTLRRLPQYIPSPFPNAHEAELQPADDAQGANGNTGSAAHSAAQTPAAADAPSPSDRTAIAQANGHRSLLPDDRRARADTPPRRREGDDCCSSILVLPDSFVDWWERKGRVKRRFGRFGKRVNETREEKDRRIMGKRAKHEGFTWLERFFYNSYTPAIRRLFPLIILAFFVLLGAFAPLFPKNLDPRTSDVKLLDEDMSTEYDLVTKRFPISGSCDMCSAYFRPHDDFPPPLGRGSGDGTADQKWTAEDHTSYNRLQKCGFQMHSPMDECGVCGGTGDCLDCMGQIERCTARTKAACVASVSESGSACYWDEELANCRDPMQYCPGSNVTNRVFMPGWRRDSCGACYLPTIGVQGSLNLPVANLLPLNASACVEVLPPTKDTCLGCALSWPNSSEQPGECNKCLEFCKTSACRAGAARNLYPPPTPDNSAVACSRHCNKLDSSDRIDCVMGVCHAYSGMCECYSNFEDGFWAGTECELCLEGFYPSPADLARAPEDYPEGVRPCTLECVPALHATCTDPSDPDCSKCEDCTVFPDSQPEDSSRVVLNPAGVTTPSDGECCVLCQSTSGCEAWTRYKQSHLCYLMEGVDSATIRSVEPGVVNTGVVVRGCDSTGKRRSDRSCACECTPQRNVSGVIKHPQCRCTACLSEEGDLGPRPAHPEAASVDSGGQIVLAPSVAVGLHCSQKRQSQCDHGTMNTTTGVCTCDPFFDDGGPDGAGCRVHSACYFHGVPSDPTLNFTELGHGTTDEGWLTGYTAHQCHCFGCWTGRYCNQTLCRNGGTCQDASSNSDPMTWQCQCVGVWEGGDCTVCPETCREHGNCPVYWPERYLSDSSTDQPPDDFRFYRCWACKGHWAGDRCETCVPPAGVPDVVREEAAQKCTPDGKILGCDGLDATDTAYKWNDACGNCAGNTANRNQCLSCEGVGNGNRSLPDACGVCNGHATDPCTCEMKQVQLEIVWGLVPAYKYGSRDPPRTQLVGINQNGVSASALFPRDTNFSFLDQETQRHLYWVCSELRQRPDLIIREQSECMMDRWRTFLLESVLVLDRGGPPTPPPIPVLTPSPTSLDTCSSTGWFAHQEVVGPLLRAIDIPQGSRDTDASRATYCKQQCCDNTDCKAWTVVGFSCRLNNGTAAAAVLDSLSGSRYAPTTCTWVRVGALQAGGRADVKLDVGETRTCPTVLTGSLVYSVQTTSGGEVFTPMTSSEQYTVTQAGRDVTVRRVDMLATASGPFAFACCSVSSGPPSDGQSQQQYPSRVEKCQVIGCPTLPRPQTPTESIVLLNWPLPEELNRYMPFLLHSFAETHGLTDHFGFSTPDVHSRETFFKLEWIRMRFTLPRLDPVMSTGEKEDLYRYWERIMRLVNNPTWSAFNNIGEAFQWSDTWIDAFTVLQAEKGTAYAIGMSTATFFVITLTFTCSPTLTILACCSVGGVIIFVITTLYLAGWTLGPAEQIGLSVMTGLAIEYTIHITEGFLEYLHATQSTLLAVRTTREQAIAGTLQRTGVPILVSAATMVLASCIILACEILIYKRIAEIVIINVMISSFHGLVVFAALIMAVGPTTVQRNWYQRVTFLALMGGFGAFTVVILYLSGSATDPQGDPLFG
eukprot:TRINITY_DN3775_c1_g1_i1.p1 TRINITY_DN3775_c1_g1~~TRINITY_DN3775_c1_g1_i1.p1  ORF type:complete len:2429 (+),score=625.51 TRINITY_DN3775_c1_g1_i1:85-7287(+)